MIKAKPDKRNYSLNENIHRQIDEQITEYVDDKSVAKDIKSASEQTKKRTTSSLLPEQKHTETKHVSETNSEEKLIPIAVPVLSPEEALLVVQKQEKEREESRKRGFVFYEEIFLSAEYVPSQTNIQQTLNWQFVPKDNEPFSNSTAKKQGFFIVNSNIPLEYTFVEPLLEHTLYLYTICCSVKGEGKIVLSKKGGKNQKEFSISSKQFEPIVYELGEGNTLNTIITPTVAFSGSLEIESITIYQKPINDQCTVCWGTIENISNVPDIKKSNYPDCYYSAEFVVKEILDGKPAPQKIQLLIPAFLNNKIDPLSTIVNKGNWKVSIRPFSLATKEEQEIELVDEIETYLYTPYILVAATTSDIPKSNASGIPILEGEKYSSPFDNPVNSPLPDSFVEDSKREIKNELVKVNSIIEQVKDEELVNAEFQCAWNEKQKQYAPLDSTKIWAREQNSFFTLPKEWLFISSDEISEENTDAIVALSQLFKSQGIQFIIQIVPDYFDIAALVLNPEFQKYGDQKSARVAKKLLERGVEVQYIADEIVKNAFHYERLFFYPYDFHPDEGTMDVMTTLMAHRLEKYGDLLSNSLDVSLFSVEKRISGYGTRLRWPENVDIGPHEPGSIVQVPYVLYNKKILDGDPNSSILVFGNSFAQEPMVKNAYISYLAPKIKHNCSCYLTSGIGAFTVLPRLFLSYPAQYFKGKRIAILPIAIKYLSNSDYTIPNIIQIDESLKKNKDREFLVSLPIKQSDSPIFCSSFQFTDINNYLSSHTSCIELSRDRPKISFPTPDGITANMIRISARVLHNFGAHLLINGQSVYLPWSGDIHSWNCEIIEIELNNNNNKSISIEMDFEKMSYKNTKVLLNNISLFK